MTKAVAEAAQTVANFTKQVISSINELQKNIPKSQRQRQSNNNESNSYLVNQNVKSLLSRTSCKERIRQLEDQLDAAQSEANAVLSNLSL